MDGANKWIFLVNGDAASKLGWPYWLVIVVGDEQPLAINDDAILNCISR